ncbi:MAG: hypothetical protein ABIN24_05105 [Dyadobacter sp.]
MVYPTSADTSAKLTISYMDGDRQKTITDLNEIEGFYDTSMIIDRSWALNNPEFTFLFNGQDTIKVRFDTYMNNAKCQGWATVSKVYENGQLLERTENRFFLIGNK